jgi:large conductance mechanosensitive channel
MADNKGMDMAMKGVGAARNLAKDFREFLFKTNVFSLALGVVIGAAVGDVVKAIVADLIMPVIGAIDTKGSWRELTLLLFGGRLKFTYGHLMGTLLDFSIIALIVFMVTKAFLKSTPPPPTKPCNACKEANHPEATRCKWCTSDLPAAPVAPPAA